MSSEEGLSKGSSIESGEEKAEQESGGTKQGQASSNSQHADAGAEENA
jgi:hypothetical protein